MDQREGGGVNKKNHLNYYLLSNITLYITANVFNMFKNQNINPVKNQRKNHQLNINIQLKTK